MRVAVIVVMMMVVTTPSMASQSCMTQAEARKHFATSHLYWHGPNHCWDATAPRHQQILARKNLIREAQRKSDRGKWQDSQDSIPDTLPADEPVRSLSTPASWEVDRQDDGDGAIAGTPWADRWVELRPSQSPLVARPVRVVQVSPAPAIEEKSAPMVSPQNVLILGFLAFMLTLGTIGVLYREEV
jgi:hypothetical protein